MQATCPYCASRWIDSDPNCRNCGYGGQPIKEATPQFTMETKMIPVLENNGRGGWFLKRKEVHAYYPGLGTLI